MKRQRLKEFLELANWAEAPIEMSALTSDFLMSPNELFYGQALGELDCLSGAATMTEIHKITINPIS